MSNVPQSQGDIIYQLVADPGGGAEWTFTMPDRVRWRLMSVKMKLTADANVADRYVSVKITHDTDLIMRMVMDTPVTNNVSVIITFNGGGSVKASLSGGVVYASMGANIIINDGCVIASHTKSMQVGDQYEDVVITVQEWIDEV